MVKHLSKGKCQDWDSNPCSADQKYQTWVQCAGPLGHGMPSTLAFLTITEFHWWQVSEWEIGHSGLMYDRHWMVVNSNGVCLSLKREERLSLIKPSIDLNNKCLWLHYQGIVLCGWMLCFPTTLCSVIHVFWKKTHMIWVRVTIRKIH